MPAGKSQCGGLKRPWPARLASGCTHPPLIGSNISRWCGTWCGNEPNGRKLSSVSSFDGGDTGKGDPAIETGIAMTRLVATEAL